MFSCEDVILDVVFNNNTSIKFIEKDVPTCLYDESDLFINPLWDIFLFTGLYPVNKEAIQEAITMQGKLRDDDGCFEPSTTLSHVLNGEKVLDIEEYSWTITPERLNYISSKNVDELVREFEKLLLEAKAKIKRD